jgi:hypothetical protein
VRKRKESEREIDTRREVNVGTNIELAVTPPRQHQTFEVTNQHAGASLDPIVFRANVLPGL